MRQNNGKPPLQLTQKLDVRSSGFTQPHMTSLKTPGSLSPAPPVILMMLFILAYQAIPVTSAPTIHIRILGKNKIEEERNGGWIRTDKDPDSSPAGFWLRSYSCVSHG